jgi:ABC-2 type transport system permease protein
MIMPRALRVILIQVKAAALLSLQYRAELAFRSALALLRTAALLVPLLVLFDMRATVAGWTKPEALVVVGFFTILHGILEGGMRPSMTALVEHVRKGTLDFVLLKPVDAQLLLSFAQIDLSYATDLLVGLALVGWGTWRAGHVPTLGDVAAGAVLLVAASAILYALWILAVSMAFRFVKIDNLSYLIVSTFDAARWPSAVFRGGFAFVFTFVIPLAVMTTWPSLAVLGRLAPREIAIALALAVAFLGASRLTWLRSISLYTSAGG